MHNYPGAIQKQLCSVSLVKRNIVFEIAIKHFLLTLPTDTSNAGEMV